MVASRSKVAVLLFAGAAASVADTVAQAAILPYDPNVAAEFGSASLDATKHVRGMLRFQLGRYKGYQTVNWTSRDVTIPTSLVEEVCGPSAGGQTFAYSINEKWTHGTATLSAQGADMCGEAHTGRHWDPSAACSASSGNEACAACGTADGYSCQPDKFDPTPDAAGSYAYRFLNKHACELGDLSGMHGELEVDTSLDCIDQGAQCEAWAKRGECERNLEYMGLHCQKSCNKCDSPAKTGAGFVTLRNLTNETAGAAQMSTAFGVISAESVTGDLIGINCDASGPPPAHGTNCECLEYNGKKTHSIGSMTVFRPLDHKTFYLAGVGLRELQNRSVVVQCGSSFGPAEGRPLFCAKLVRGGGDE